ncbi:glycosyltransferase [Longibacter sp.]|uniref:glycosyltransferase n=1 Tax=Longibacter sp. TaxID=2045415 RepID=UPI003EBD9A6B
MPRLLLISYRFPPESYPLANSLAGVVRHLQTEWDVDVVTAAEGAISTGSVRIHHVPGCAQGRLSEVLRQLRLDKLDNLMTWPDPYRAWVDPALEKASSLVDRHQHDAAIVFMMPFSSGFVGTALKSRTGIPLVLNLDDSPTCSDMHPAYPSRWHYRQSIRLEDMFIRASDRVIYVSEHNRDRVAARHPASFRERLRVIRCSADPPDVGPSAIPVSGAGTGRDASSDDVFRIVYTGAMTGWYALDPMPRSPSKRLYQAWNRIGQHRLTTLDRKTHSPVYIGQAIQRVLRRNPTWRGRVYLDVFGNTYPDDVTQRVLADYGVSDVVRLHGRIKPDAVRTETSSADLLFMSLPDRLDGSPGGRISLKTYEYALTDRPILAALPDGENRSFLTAVPGVHLTGPSDSTAMADVIEDLAHRTFDGEDLSVSRPKLRKQVSSEARARAISDLLFEVAVVSDGDAAFSPAA